MFKIIFEFIIQRQYCCKIKSTIFENTKTSVGVLIQSQSKNVAYAIINKIIEKYVNCFNHMSCTKFKCIFFYVEQLMMAHIGVNRWNLYWICCHYQMKN